MSGFECKEVGGSFAILDEVANPDYLLAPTLCTCTSLLLSLGLKVFRGPPPPVSQAVVVALVPVLATPACDLPFADDFDIPATGFYPAAPQG